MAARRVFHCLTLLLLPALLPKGILAGTRLRMPFGAPADRRGPEPVPYLPYLGAPPLRFQDALPEPDLSARPPSAAPPIPHLTHTESSVGMANAAAAKSIPAPGNNDAQPAEAGGDGAAKTAPISILPDTVRPQVQPEDFLPFFLTPDAARSALPAPAPSEPGLLPPSSAIYFQTPK